MTLAHPGLPEGSAELILAPILKMFIFPRSQSPRCSDITEARTGRLRRELTEARIGRLRRELKLTRSHPKDVSVGALQPAGPGQANARTIRVDHPLI